MRALSEHTGGARWGGDKWTAQYASWPFAHLHVCDDRLILTTPDGAFDFPRDSVTRLVCNAGGWFSRFVNLPFGGLQIEHAVDDYPSFILFSSFDIGSVCEQLKTAGFNVST
jgi:hypothetical protein